MSKFKVGDRVWIPDNGSDQFEEHGTITKILGNGLYAVVSDDSDPMSGKYREWDETQMQLESNVNEMGLGAITGFQAPLGAKERKKKIDDCIAKSGDLHEGHVLTYITSGEDLNEFYEFLDLDLMSEAADLIREHVVRMAVRKKIEEVVRKKAGGGGFVLYAPNKGKKHPSHPVGHFPTKLAAKRAELARFPPKDAKKLKRLRREINRLMKDPKKRAEAERRAAKQKGTLGIDAPKPKKRKRKTEAWDLIDRAVISEVMSRDMMLIGEGLFREDAKPSQWDEFIKKVSSKVLSSDPNFQRVQKKVERATKEALAQAMKIVQKQLGNGAKVRAAKEPGSQDGSTYIPFNIEIDAADTGPYYVYISGKSPDIEISDEAKNTLTKVSPEVAKTIRAALAMAQDSLGGLTTVQDAIAARDSFFEKLSAKTDAELSAKTPAEISMLKYLLVQKYRKLDR